MLSNFPSGHGGSILVTHGRVLVSIRITSAPRCANCSVQYGPAHTHVKSQTRIPESGGGFFIPKSHPCLLVPPIRIRAVRTVFETPPDFVFRAAAPPPQ